MIGFIIGARASKRFRDRARSEEKPARRRKKVVRNAKKGRKKAPK